MSTVKRPSLADAARPLVPRRLPFARSRKGPKLAYSVESPRSAFDLPVKTVDHSDRSSPRRAFCDARALAQVRFGKLDDFIASPAEDRAQHEQAKPLRMRELDLGRHRKFVLRCHHIDERRPRM